LGAASTTARSAAESRTPDANDSDAAARTMPSLPVKDPTDEFKQENSVVTQGARS